MRKPESEALCASRRMLEGYRTHQVRLARQPFAGLRLCLSSEKYIDEMTNINFRISQGHSNYNTTGTNNSDSGVSTSSSRSQTHSCLTGLNARQSRSGAPHASNPALRQGVIARKQTLIDELLHKMGNCGSAPQVSSPGRFTDAGPSTAAPARPSTSVFNYRTAELSNANVNGICVGLTAEWFLNRSNNASDRMAALLPGSEGHESAAQRQKQYQKSHSALRREGLDPAQADLQAQNTMLRNAGLNPASTEKRYFFGDPESSSNLFEKITKSGSKQLLTLHFEGGGKHTVATSTSNGETTLFDPNYGEFSVPMNNVESLFQSLSNRYVNPNGQHLSIVTTLRM
jgi:YopT-type cysteine protease-like protein